MNEIEAAFSLGDVQRKYSQARARMLMKQVFWATILLSTPAVMTKDVPRAATDMKKIYWNPAFFATLDVEVICFVLAHEVMHIVLKHGLRMGNRNPDRWNRACDYAINWLLVKAGFKLWQDAHGNVLCLYDERFANMSAEAIYEILKKEDAEREKSGVPNPTDGLHGDVKAPENASDPRVVREIERQISQTVAQAANMARMAGQGSADLERVINDLLNPKVAWQQQVQHLMFRVTYDDETWNRRSRRFSDIYLPTRYSLRMGKVGIGGDTSGSIGTDELTQMATEVRYVCDTLRPEEIRAVWCDDRIKGEQVFGEYDLFEPKPVGGGGTDMRVLIEHFEQHQPDVMILFTDGCTPWPDAPPSYPLIICCTTGVEIPEHLGDVVRIN